MKLWCMLKTDNKIVLDKVMEFNCKTPSDASGWHDVLKDICSEFDLACPVVLQKHINDLARFSRAIFRQGDFMEPLAFDKFEVEILKEKKPALQ